MARRKKWTMAEAVAWLRERVTSGASESVKGYYPNSVFDYSDSMHALIDPKTCELDGFVFDVADVSCWPVETFTWGADWGTCKGRARHGEDLVWVTDACFAGPLDEGLVTEYHRLLRAYIQPEWFDVTTAWCSEGSDDLPPGYLEAALMNLGEVTFWIDEDDNDSCCLFVCRNEKERKKLARKHMNLRQLDVDQAIHHAQTRYGDCFDWP